MCITSVVLFFVSRKPPVNAKHVHIRWTEQQQQNAGWNTTHRIGVANRFSSAPELKNFIISLSLSYYSFYISFVSPLPELYEPFVDDNLTPCALLYNTFFDDDRNVLKNETKHKKHENKKNPSWFFLCFVSLPAHFRYNLTNRSKFMRSKRATYGWVVSLIYIMDW